jgi:AcrR family transcriptional regulator
MTASDTARRPYDSPVRRQRAAETRERIVAAGSELVHALPSWDWHALTFRAVAARAGVGERTVYRYFPSERHLHDAVMQRLEQEAGVTYEGVALDEVATVASRVFASLASFAAAPTSPRPSDPTFGAQDDRRRAALREAVDAAAPHWSWSQREAVAAALDILWSPPAYERLLAWRLEHGRATSVISWLIGLVVEAIERDAPPPMHRHRRPT